MNEDQQNNSSTSNSTTITSPNLHYHKCYMSMSNHSSRHKLTHGQLFFTGCTVRNLTVNSFSSAVHFIYSLRLLTHDKHSIKQQRVNSYSSKQHFSHRRWCQTETRHLQSSACLALTSHVPRSFWTLRHSAAIQQSAFNHISNRHHHQASEGHQHSTTWLLKQFSPMYWAVHKKTA